MVRPSKMSVLFVGKYSQSVTFQILIDLNTQKARAHEHGLELLARIDRHSINYFLPLLMAARLAACLVRNHEHPAVFQNAINLGEAACNLRPEVHCLKRCHNLKQIIIKR